MYIEEKVENILRQLDRISKTLLELDQKVRELRVDVDMNKATIPYNPYTWPNYDDVWKKYYTAPPPVNRCPVCQMSWEGPMGYVCANPQCPNRVTCTSTTTTMAGTPPPSNTTYYSVYGTTLNANTDIRSR